MIDLTRAKDIFAQHKIDLSDEQLGQLELRRIAGGMEPEK